MKITFYKFDFIQIFLIHNYLISSHLKQKHPLTIYSRQQITMVHLSTTDSIRRTTKLRQMLLLFFLVCMLILIGYFLVNSYFQRIEMAKEQEFKKLACTVNSTAYSFDGDAHQYLVEKYILKDAIQKNNDDSLYQELNQYLNAIRMANDISVPIYTLVVNQDANLENLENASFFGVTSAESPYFRHEYSPPSIMLEKYQEGGTMGPYTSENGTWLSAFAPFRDSLNNVVGVIEADADFSIFIKDAQEKFLRELTISAIIFLAVTLIVLFILQMISKELGKMQTALSNSYEKLNTTYSSITKFAEKIGEGDLDAELEMTEQDALSESLVKMRSNLKTARLQEETQIRIAKGIEKISLLLRQDESDFDDFCQTVFKELLTYSGTHLGILYLSQVDNNQQISLKPKATFGYSEQHKTSIKPNEGLIGRAFSENELIHLQNPPKDYLKITSGLGQESASEIIILPLSISKQVIGVVEMATLNHFPEEVLEYFKEALVLIASSFYQRKSSQQTMDLLEEARKRNIELKGAYLEMERVRNDALAAKQIAEKASNVKSEFLANMSHELRTPLNGVIGYAQILMEESDLKKSHREKIKVMHSSAEHLLGLINNVLDISKIEAGKQEVFESDFELEFFIQDLLKMLAIKANNKGLRLEYNLDKKLPEIIATDKGKLRQCLINLINNALKFTQEGGVTLDIRKEKEGFIGFHVIDTGVGVPQEKIQSILKPFNQIQETAANIEGTGLGLTITQNFVELIGGKFDIRSRVGHGSTFSILIPLKTKEGKYNYFTEKEKIITGYQGEQVFNILIVDDIEVNRKVAKEILQKVGFQISEAVNGLKGIEIAMDKRPDLILGDIRMPVLDGIDMVKRIRLKEEIANTPIIAITASAEHVKRSEVLTAGFDDFIAKPFRLQELLEMVGRHLKLKYIYQELKPEFKEDKILSLQDIDFQQVNSFLPKNFKTNFEEKVNKGDLEEAKNVADNLLRDIPELADFFKLIYQQIEEFNFDRLEEILSRLT